MKKLGISLYVILTILVSNIHGGETKDMSESDTSVNEIVVEGIGLVKVGQSVIHKKYGKGIVKFIDATEFAVIGMIEFEGESKPLLISSEYFEPLP